MVTAAFLFDYLRQHRLGIIATTNAGCQAEAALVGIAVTPALEIVFDTVMSSRKYSNLRAHPECAFVIGWEGISTVQYEGTARELRGEENDHYREVYYAAYPDGRDRAANWEGLVHFVVTPRWCRYSSFGEEKVIEELRW
jgi:hypothetical protein